MTWHHNGHAWELLDGERVINQITHDGEQYRDANWVPLGRVWNAARDQVEAAVRLETAGRGKRR